MEISAFLQHFKQLQGLDETANYLQQAEMRIHWKGLIGSSKSIAASSVAEQVPGNHLFILEDKEAAAYFLNDLEQLFPENKHILFYPASYRTPYQLEETDNANVVARAEVLEKINSGKNTWVVTYPQALFERIPTQKNLNENTMRVERGKSYSIDFFNELLLEYGFERVDFVYEPGQFSIRGGIVDIFSFSNDEPFRVEFFGDEVDSIRTFDPVSQLSINTHVHFSIVPNVQRQLVLNGTGTFLEFIGKQATVWLASFDLVKSALEKDYEKAVRIYDNLPKNTIKHTIP